MSAATVTIDVNARRRESFLLRCRNFMASPVVLTAEIAATFVKIPAAA
jgi:hypothetical protein